MEERVADLTSPPVARRVYLVPCVLSVGFWLPVIGPPHADPELGVVDAHWHYDFRFFTKTLAKRYFDWIDVDFYWDGKQGPLWQLMGTVRPCVGADGERLPIEERLMRCQRPMPEFRSLSELASEKWGKLQRKYRRACLTACKVCPHRGLPLGSIPPNDAGEIVCAGHGLRFSAATGKLVMQKRSKL